MLNDLTMDNKFFLHENINIFGHLVAWGGGDSIISLGPSWFTFTLSFILIYLSNMEAIWQEPLELKYI